MSACGIRIGERTGSESTFTLRMTQIMKGVSIIIMVIHHTIPNNPGLPVGWTRGEIPLFIGTAAKVCVCLFTILSGYGIAVSWKNREDHRGFTRRHIVKLWFSFVFIFVFAALWKGVQGTYPPAVYGSGAMGFLYFLKDLFGLQNLVVQTPSMMGVWWYMETIFICYILFPLFYKIIHAGKKPAFALLFVLYIPWIVYFVKQGWGWHTDRELFYLFSFALGIFCAEFGLFDRAVRFAKERRLPMIGITAPLMIVMALIRSRLCLIWDPFWALTVIMFCLCTAAAIPVLSNLLAELGAVSSDMYMFHPLVIGALRAFSFTRLSFRIAVTVLLCWGIALGLAKFRGLIRYDRLSARAAEAAAGIAVSRVKTLPERGAEDT